MKERRLIMKGLTLFERRQNILRLLAERPGLRVADMAEIFQVTEGTIRNDLNALESEEKVRRVRGGAVLLPKAASNGDRRHYDVAAVSHAEVKKRIARWAADTIEDGDTIFLDASSTVRFIVPHLQEHSRLTIVTNGLETARETARNTVHPVVLIGGTVSRSGKATTGLIGLEMLKNLHIRSAYVSCVGFHLQTGLTERLIEEAQLKEAVLATIPRLVALVGSDKIGEVSTAPFAGPDRITHLFTDSDVSADFIEQMRQARINLTVCGENTVRSYTLDGEKPQFTIGFANQSEELPFAIDVRRGLERAAADMGSIDLVTADNRLSGEEALHVADKLIARGVDLVIEYQIDYQMGSRIMDKFQRARIPVIAVDIPMVGATFFGVDNYRCGYVAGIALGEWLKDHWQAEFDCLIVLEELRAGALPAARIKGQLDGLEEIIGQLPAEKITRLDSGNTSSISEAEVVKTLQAMPGAHRLAIVCFNTDAAIGALRAAQSLGREQDVAIVGQGADRLLLNEIRHPESRVIGSTAYMPEHYGDKLLELALKILRGEPVPPAVYTEHIFITADNIDRYYPGSRAQSLVSQGVG